MVFCFTIVTLLLSCATSATFKTSKIVPSAIGEVKVKGADNGNFRVTVRVEHMAMADKLTPPAKCYVVWTKTSAGEYNIGTLSVSESLEGSLEAESTYEPDRILVSAESDEKATKKSKRVVLKSGKL